MGLLMATPTIGTDVRIRAESDTVYYNSRVTDMNDDFLFVDIPTHPFTFEEMQVQVDAKVFIEYAMLSGEVYRYSSRILGVAYIPIPTVRVTAPLCASDLERIQRRAYFRTSIDAQVRVDVSRTNRQFVTQALDISGGGLAVVGRNHLDVTEGEPVQVSFVLPYIEIPLDIACRIVRQWKDRQGNEMTSMQFVDIKERDRDHIIRYTFMRQRSLKR